MEQAGGPGGEAGSQFGRHFSKLIDDGLTWEFLPWLKSVTRLPVLVKVRGAELTLPSRTCMLDCRAGQVILGEQGCKRGRIWDCCAALC